ncbi:AMP-binding protein [Longivirga aurantiaca]|uniref:AMP-binding protein n=1 Tax=Longivirga aurantiaca TaxID=1837743 RepID=A0ABW1T3D0_9ACTN
MAIRVQGKYEALIRERAATDAHDVWLKFRDETYSWSDVLSAMSRVANGLLELGVRPGDRVMIVMSNRPEFLWSHLGIIMIGAHSVPVSTQQRGETLRHMIVDSRAKAILVEGDYLPHVLAASQGVETLQHIVGLGTAPSHAAPVTFERLFASPDTEPDVDLSDAPGGSGLIYTSGTTGPPKGVVATAYDFGPMELVLRASGVQPGETMYAATPLYHGNALLVQAMGSITVGAKFALGERFSASRWWDEIRRYDAVEFNAVGAMIPILLKQPARSDDADNPVRALLSMACPADSWREFERRFGVRIIETYGMVDAVGSLLNDVGKVGSVGKPVPGVEYRIVDDEDRALGPGEVGEITFRHAKGQMTDYENRPEETAHAYRGGWFHSGDLGEYDEDGFYYYRGRKKESMRRRGVNVSAWEIESVLISHPDVLEVAAHAVPSPLGEDDIKVVIRPVDASTLTPEDVLRFCEGRMAYQAIPRYVEFVEEVPKTPTQRPMYGVLKERGLTPATWDREAAGFEVRR